MLQVLQKYLETDDQCGLQVTYDFFVGSVIPQYPTVSVAQFADTITQLSATNPQVKDFDPTKVLDNSLVQSAIDRNVGG